MNKYINKDEYTRAGAWSSFDGFASLIYNKTVICLAFASVIVASPISAVAAGDKTPAGKPLDEKILALIDDKSERLGLTAFGDIDGDKKDEIVVTVDRASAADPAGAPESKLALFDGEKLSTIDAFSVYIERLELTDIDGCGNKEIIFIRRGGMKNLMEVFVLKAEKNSSGERAYKISFKSDGVRDGKFDIIKTSATGEKVADGLTMIIGGYLDAPGAIAPHLEFSHFYTFDGAGRAKLARKHYERPKTLSQEYEMAYLSLLENDKAGAKKRFERIIGAAKNARSEDSADIIKACEEALAGIK